MTNHMIRMAVAEDAASLADLHAACFGPRGERVWTRQEWQDMLVLPQFCCLVSVGGGQGLNGAMLAQFGDQTADIITIMTAPDYRNQGIAGEILSAACEQLTLHEVETLVLEVAADNKAALAFYEKHGFIQVGTRRNYYKRRVGTRIDGQVLQRPLP